MVLVLVLVLAAGSARVAYADEDAVADAEPPVFLAVRPVDARGRTELRGLPEAQKLRAIVADSLAAAGHPALGEDEQTQLLGKGYLRELLACDKKLACAREHLKPLRGTNPIAIVVEYAVVKKMYRIEVITFSVDGNDVPRRASLKLAAARLRDEASWLPSLATLFPAAEPVAAPPEPVEAPAEPVEAPPEPVRLPPPPTQNNAAGGGAAKVEEAPMGLSMFGKIGWEAIIDPQNQGDYLQEESPPPAIHPADWHVGFPNVDYIGAVFVGPKRGGWQARGTAVLGLLYYRKFRLDVAWGEIRNDDVGFSLTVGRIYNPIVNSLDPGTYGDQTELGSILYVLNGIKASQAVGRFTFDLGVGRPESVTLGETPPLEGSAGSIYGESRLSYMNPNITGVLYGRPTPLVLSVSGAIGVQRVGPGENLGALATPPPPAVTESLPAWMASAEARVPLGPLMLLGEVYVGRGAAFYGGAMYRFERIDLTTGDHSLLLSCGYWGQLSVRPSHATELIAVAGVDRNLSGFAGVDAGGSADITSNRWLAGILNIDLTREFRLGLQGEWITSSYPKYGTFSHPGAIIDFSFHW